MNNIRKTIAIVGITTVIGGIPTAVYAQLPPSQLLSAADNNKATMSAVDLYNRGVDKLDAGDYEGAIADFNEAIRLAPQDAESYYNRGYARHILGAYQQAIADYTEPIRINHEYGNA